MFLQLWETAGSSVIFLPPIFPKRLTCFGVFETKMNCIRSEKGMLFPFHFILYCFCSQENDTRNHPFLVSEWSLLLEWALSILEVFFRKTFPFCSDRCFEGALYPWDSCITHSLVFVIVGFDLFFGCTLSRKTKKWTKYSRNSLNDIFGRKSYASLILHLFEFFGRRVCSSMTSGHNFFQTLLTSLKLRRNLPKDMRPLCLLHWNSIRKEQSCKRETPCFSL